MKLRLLISLSLIFSSQAALSATFEIQSALFGYMRGVYGNGSRYGSLQGHDRIGLSQFAVGVEAKVKENYKFVGLFAGDVLSDGTGAGADVSIKDTFVEIDSIANSDFGLTLGAQPFLFGLKANGYPGDHSIVPSIEFMTIFGKNADGDFTRFDNRGFAVSQQAGPSAKITYNMNKENRVVLGAFDTNESVPSKNEGSSVDQNVFLYYRSDRLAIDGLKFFAGAMTRYIGQQPDGTSDVGQGRMMFDLGAAYTFGSVDVSLEAISVCKRFAGTDDNEMLLVAESELRLDDRNAVYLDYGNAQEMEITTWRGGFRHQVSPPLSLQAELSQDVYGNGRVVAATEKKEESYESFDVMLKYVF